MVADMAIMCDVHVGHQKIVISDGGQHSSAFSAAMDRCELAHAIPIANAGCRSLAVILQVLGRHADGRVWKEDVVLAQC